MTVESSVTHRRKLMLRLSLLSALIYSLLSMSFLFYSPASFALSKERQAELIYLLKQDCGSCHGLTLKGGLGPAILATELEGKPLEYIKSVITHGRPGTPMPPWKNILTPEQIHFLAAYLLSPQNRPTHTNMATGEPEDKTQKPESTNPVKENNRETNQ